MSLNRFISRRLKGAIYLAILLVLACAAFRMRPQAPRPISSMPQKTFTVHPGYVTRSANYTLTAEIHGS
jgi:hypothetical protein